MLTASAARGAMATVDAIKQAAAYTIGAVEGAVVASTPIYNQNSAGTADKTVSWSVTQ